MLNLLRTLHRCFARSRRVAGRCPAVEVLEGRALPTVLQPYSHLLGPLDGPGAVPGYTPTQIRHVYGFDQVNFTPGAAAATGAGVTIAIVTAFDDPNLAADLATFNARFNLPAAPLTQVAQDGSPNLPAADASWAQETAMDVEWAHAMAPGAGLLVVEANSGDEADLYAAVDQATSRPDVQVVSMSFGGPEDPAETNADQHFLTPAGHAGITFVAAAGDTGAVSYPAASPNVLAVGGTTLNLAADGSRASETAWASGGGGLSQYESAAGFQAAVQPAHLASRGSPDVAYNANPTTGFAVCDSFNDPNRPWISVGGTSAGAPQWAALIALADQGRALAGQGSLDGPTQTLPLLYSAPGAFYDVIQGGNDHFQAGPGYDLVTGLGTPLASKVVVALLSPPQSPSPNTSGGPPATNGPGSSGNLGPLPPPPGILTATGLNVSAVSGVTSTGALATVNDPWISVAALAAVIDWGNGQTSAGTIVPLSSGQFYVEGDLDYAQAGPYTITVTITADDGSGQSVTVDTLADVGPAPQDPSQPGTSPSDPGSAAPVVSPSQAQPVADAALTNPVVNADPVLPSGRHARPVHRRGRRHHTSVTHHPAPRHRNATHRA